MADPQTNKRRRWIICCVIVLSLIIAPLNYTDETEAAMDRSAAVLGASIHEFANFLYLSDLFGKPTVIPPYEKFCGKTLSTADIQALRNDIQRVTSQGFWDRKCAPVVAFGIKKNANGRFDAKLAYIKLSDSRKWIFQLERAILHGELPPEPLVPLDRQLELTRLHNPEFKSSNHFSYFGRRGYVELLLKDFAKIAKRITEPPDHGVVGELVFTE